MKLSTSVSLQTLIERKQLKFWKKVKQLDDHDPLKKIINEAKYHKIGFIKHYEKLDEQYQNEDEIIDIFYRNIRENIQKKVSEGRTKYETYMKINPALSVLMSRFYYILIVYYVSL